MIVIKKIEIDLKKLENEYLKEGNNIKVLAEKYHCSETTINNKLKINNNPKVLEKMKRRSSYTFIRHKKKCRCPNCNKYEHTDGMCLAHYHETFILDKLIHKYDFNNKKILYKKKNVIVDTLLGYCDLVIYSKKYKKYAVVKISHESVDVVKLSTWRLNGNGYIICRKNKKDTLMHRLIMNPNNDDVIDHINGDRWDNRLENLRIINQSTNQVNKGLMSNNTSGITGVTWDKTRNKWKSSLNINGKCYNLGRYDLFEDAVKARLKAEKKYHGEYSPRHDFLQNTDINDLNIQDLQYNEMSSWNF